MDLRDYSRGRVTYPALWRSRMGCGLCPIPCHDARPKILMARLLDECPRWSNRV